MPQPVQLNLEAMDDQVVGDATPSFLGGQVSNEQANLLADTESALLINCDRSRLGKITTRKGTVAVGAIPGGVAGPIQGMVYFWTKDYQYPVAACQGKIYAYQSGAWNQIATGGAFDNDVIQVVKAGRINNAAGYPVGTTTFIVDTFIGPVANGDKLVLYQRDKYFEYNINASVTTAGNVTSITVDNPGSVVAVFDNDSIVVKRFGMQINNPSNYPAGATVLTVDGITGAVGTGDVMTITGDNSLHQITGHTETAGNTTSITISPGLLSAYVSSSTTTPIMFAKGVDQLFWTDGIGSIWSWDGKHTGNLALGNIYDFTTAPPPTAASILVWFQNRLIASGIASEPDAIYFSDILDPTRWDKTYNSLRVGGGEGDPIQMLMPWMDLNLVVFKKDSIYVINMDPSQNFTPEDPTALVGSFAIKLITRHVGTVAPRSVMQVGGTGGDIFFLATDRQVRSLRRTLAAESQQELGQPVSLPIKDLLDRITPSYIQNSVATYWDSRYILAIPIDGAQYAGSTMVYDTALNSWSGIWIGWLPTAFSGMVIPSGLLALTIGNSTGGVIQWLEDTGADETLDSTYQDLGTDIPTGIWTRAYSFGDLYIWKTGLNVEFEFNDSIAQVTVVANLDQTAVPGNIAIINTNTTPALTIPFVIPATLPTATFMRVQKDLQALGQFREIQLYIASVRQKLSMRSVKLTGFYDSLQIQTLGDTPFL